MIKQLIFAIRLKEKNLRYFFYSAPQKSVTVKVPYYAQFESRELIADILEKRVKTAYDPLWKNSGANTKSEYALWSHNGCGMACLKMILASKTGKEYSIVSLGKKCMEHGGYRGKKLSGLFYKPFLSFINEEFHLAGKVMSPMHVKDIIKNLSNKHFVIVSVAPQIGSRNINSGKAGGHLVLVTGYNISCQYLTIHNPSGKKRDLQENVKISFRDFETFFAHRGIVVY